MKLHLAQLAGTNQFTGYGPGYVSVNNTRHSGHLLVMADRLLPWEIAGFGSLAAQAFDPILALEPEIVVLGTGATLRFPSRGALQPLASAAIGTEIMDSRAACRTYNILIAEGRRVLAAVLVE